MDGLLNLCCVDERVMVFMMNSKDHFNLTDGGGRSTGVFGRRVGFDTGSRKSESGEPGRAFWGENGVPAVRDIRKRWRG
ncbi:hypothetical protein C1H46_025443 [Malus baccata]|uniref:Uncharacterized protein n=1 Tax=Malus baccata TaxID=106549 RepID=A0A540LS06_MALBA|nr:hypothetical protein C1H46_025443 [Malus baccata]